jgi:hypothetical protein
MLDPRRNLCGASDGSSVRVISVEHQHSYRPIEYDVVTAPQGAAFALGDLFDEVVAADESFHLPDATARACLP